MALTQAEKQKAFRERHIQTGYKVRLQVVLPAATKQRLDKLAEHRTLTATLIELIDAATGNKE